MSLLVRRRGGLIGGGGDQGGGGDPAIELYGGEIRNGWWRRPAYPSEPSPTGSGVRRTASNVTELNSAIASAGPGDVIWVANGTYTDPNTAGYTDGGVDCTGTEENPIIFYAESQHGVLIRHTDVNKLCWYQTNDQSWLEIWGFDLWSDTVSYQCQGHGSFAKWCKIVSTEAAPAARHRRNSGSNFGGVANSNRMRGGGLWYCDVTNESGGIGAEGHYVGLGEIPAQDANDNMFTNVMDGLSTIGCYFVGCAGGAIDIKANNFNYVARFNVIDGDDYTSGIINVNSGVYLVPMANRSALGDETDYVVSDNIVRMTDLNADTTYADGMRIGGHCTINNNIVFANSAGNKKSAFLIHTKGLSGGTYPSEGLVTATVVLNENRGHGFDAFDRRRSESSSDSLTIISANNRSDVAPNEFTGTVVADGVYVGPLTGTAVDDSIATGGGLGTGFYMTGADTGYEVV